jgi:hypothetical protein
LVIKLDLSAFSDAHILQPKAILVKPKEATHGGTLRNRNFGLMAIFALAMFFSTALLFLVQAMFPRMVLPLLGETPNVWNTAVVFYQFEGEPARGVWTDDFSSIIGVPDLW